MIKTLFVSWSREEASSLRNMRNRHPLGSSTSDPSILPMRRQRPVRRQPALKHCGAPAAIWPHSRHREDGCPSRNPQTRLRLAHPLCLCATQIVSFPLLLKYWWPSPGKKSQLLFGWPFLMAGHHLETGDPTEQNSKGQRYLDEKVHFS